MRSSILGIRAGGRTYFGRNDPWRLQGYLAYGFGDDKFKYGLSGKWMVAKKNRVILSGGNRRDVEQIGASLTNTNDVLGRSFASSAVFTTSSNGKLTNINLTTLACEIEPIKNLAIQGGVSYRTLESASPTFSLDYYKVLPTPENPAGLVESQVTQAETNIQVDFTPRRKTIGFGVERSEVDSPYSRVFLNYNNGLKGLFNSDFDYHRLQLYYRQPLIIGAIGRTNFTTELGKTFGTVPLGLMSIVPGNQTYFTIDNTFSNLNFYEFVADTYATFQVDHHFNGKLFAYVPYHAQAQPGARSCLPAASTERFRMRMSRSTPQASCIARQIRAIGNTASVSGIFSRFSASISHGVATTATCPVRRTLRSRENSDFIFNC
jgi:hypothetical protein